MANICVIFLIFALGANFLLIQATMQAKVYGAGGLGKLYQDKMTDEGVVGGLLSNTYHTISSVACGLFGSHVLPMMSKNNHCPEGSFAANTFDSLENLCECMRSSPQLRDCMMLAAVTTKLDIRGLIDVTHGLGQCCDIDLGDTQPRVLRSRDNLVIVDGPRNPDALLNELAYGLTDGASDLLCALIGPNFLRLLLTDSGCFTRDTLTPDEFESKECFCDRFRNEWSSDTKTCLTDDSIEILVKMKGITNYQIDLGTCCAHCPGKEPANTPPPSKSNSLCESLVTVPKC